MTFTTGSAIRGCSSSRCKPHDHAASPADCSQPALPGGGPLAPLVTGAHPGAVLGRERGGGFLAATAHPAGRRQPCLRPGRGGPEKQTGSSS